jgi:NADH-quinone oxidoreductase subunit D
VSGARGSGPAGGAAATGGRLRAARSGGGAAVLPDSLRPYYPAGDLFRIETDGDRVGRLVVERGGATRAVERMAEGLSWDRLLPLLERVCGVCSVSHSAAAVRALEDLAGVQAPERGQFLRTLACELERIQSHLLWFGLLGRAAGFESLWMAAWTYRDLLCSVFERWSGSRVLPALLRVGGVSRDLQPEDVPWVRERLERLKPALGLLEGVLAEDPVFRSRTAGAGAVTERDARGWGAVGPLARASGVAADVRKDDPYFAYPWVDWNLSFREAGDVLAGAEVRWLEMRESVGIAVQCLERMRPGPVRTADPAAPAAGLGLGRVEAPRGELVHVCVSDGAETPVRYQIRGPSAANLPALEASLPGTPLEDAVVALAAADPCLGCVERIAVLDPASGGGDGRRLLGMSLARTARLRAAAAGGGGAPA